MEDFKSGNMKSNYFYSEADIKHLKDIIRTGEPVRQIAARLHVEYETSPKIGRAHV